MTNVIRYINNLNDRVGKIVALLSLPMMVVVTWEVVARYVFNSPTMWAHETSQFLNGTLIMLGGAYTLRWGAHVNADIIYAHLPLRKRAIVNVITWPLFFIFVGVLLWQSWISAWNSTLVLESSFTPWAPPIWPVKLTIPLGALLLLLQGLAIYANDLHVAITGRQIADVTGKEMSE